MGKIKRKIVKAKTSVNIDFTDAKNKVKSSRRRHLSGTSAGTDVTVDLEYENDTEAEAGKTAVKATDFADNVGKDLKNEGVETTLTGTSATIETVEKEVVEEVLEDAPTTTTTAPATTTAAATTTTAPSKTATTNTAAPATTTKTTPSLRKTQLLSSAPHTMIASPFSIFFVTLIAIITSV